jgi:dimethylglycine dehydrogenase
MDGRGRARARILRHGCRALRPLDDARLHLPKVVENYQTRFSVSYPNEELPAARPFRTTPMYDIFDGMGAVWGQQYGLEVANYFALPGEPTLRDAVVPPLQRLGGDAREVQAVRGGVGINEVHNFAKYRS